MTHYASDKLLLLACFLVILSVIFQCRDVESGMALLEQGQTKV